MQFQSSKNNPVISELNIVPFVDIVLVILIIFLIISPTFIQPGFDIQLPRAQNAEKPQNVKAFLSINIEGVLFFNQKPLNPEELSQKLKNMVQKNREVKVVIAADQNVAHGNVISLIDLVSKAGVKKFAVSVQTVE